MASEADKTVNEPFPAVEDECSQGRNSADVSRMRSRTISNASSTHRPRRTSIARAFLESNPPNGMWQATGEIAAKAPTLVEIRRGSFSQGGWTEEGQRENRGTDPHEIQRSRRSRHSSASTRSRATNATGVGTPTANLDIHPEEDEHTHLEQEQAIRRTSHTPSLQITNHPSTQQPPNQTETTDASSSSEQTNSTDSKLVGPDETGTYPNGYRFPPKHTWREATLIGLKAFWRFIWTPFGFVVFIYGLNVVGWGAMIFFVLLNAAPAMCHPSCDSDDSPRKKWIETDSQVLNALFCVTGFGLIPWRFRDLWWELHWRLFGSKRALRFLAGIHRGWFRLAGSEELDDKIGPPVIYTKKNPQLSSSPPPSTDAQIAELEANDALPLPATSIPPAPLTGVRAPPTATWKLDFVVWMYVINTLLQVVLCVAMWNWNRFNRPSWLQGFAIALACTVAILAGLLVFIEGKKIKAVEGIPVHEEEVFEDIENQNKSEKTEAKPNEKSSNDTAREELVVSRVEKKKGRHWYERH